MTPDNVDQSFFALIFTFHQSAMFALGKLANPLTNKVELNLDQAQYAIDTLAMLAQKTVGNLNEAEDKFLKNTLQELRLNYVYEQNQQKNKPANDKNEDKSEVSPEQNKKAE